jgi:D-amino-acid dehydrogenase
MRVLVLGSGVVGVASAWYLARAGHEVTIVDRQPGPALETSFANGGQVSWGSGNPWAAPDIPFVALKWLLKPHSPLVLRPTLDPAMWTWLLRMLGQCVPRRYARNKQHMLRLARYSYDCLKDLKRDTGIHYDERTRGALVLLRGARELDRARRESADLGALGIPQQLLDASQCRAHEPALARVAGKVAGGLLFPDEESGDCRAFCEQLTERARVAGVRFRYSTTIESLVAGSGTINAVETDRGRLDADAYVLACGSYSPLLLAPLGLRLPVYPVKGYSITLPISDETAAPQGTLTDETYKTVITRLGNRLRAAGTAELAGYNLQLHARRIETLKHVMRDLFPDAGDVERAEAWTGLRPMTPDNSPVLGETPFRNLYLNTGHGTLGWTMACGSGKVLADVISGREPDIDLDGLTFTRFR